MMCFTRLGFGARTCFSSNDLLKTSTSNSIHGKFNSLSQFNHTDIQIASINGMNKLMFNFLYNFFSDTVLAVGDLYHRKVETLDLSTNKWSTKSHYPYGIFPGFNKYAIAIYKNKFILFGGESQDCKRTVLKTF